ncbi:MAG: DUF3572 domain-containing protein [Rhizobiaceae bacterium]
MKNTAIDQETAEALAVNALGFIASSEALLPRFLQLTGIEASAIREAAAEPGFLAGVLQFIAAHEPTLIAFCEATGAEPQSVGMALRALPLGDGEQQAGP